MSLHWLTLGRAHCANTVAEGVQEALIISFCAIKLPILSNSLLTLLDGQQHRF